MNFAINPLGLKRFLVRLKGMESFGYVWAERYECGAGAVRFFVRDEQVATTEHDRLLWFREILPHDQPGVMG